MAKITERMPVMTDVSLIINGLGIPEEGREISKDEVAKLIMCSPTSNRFGTVVAKWKELLFDAHNVHMIPTFRGSWVSASPEERIIDAVKLKNQALRKMSKAVAVACSSDCRRLSENSVKIQRKIRDQLNAAKLMLASQL